jgi:hypothetical protein
MTIPPISLGIIKGAEWLKALNAEMFTYGQSHGYMNKNAEHTSVHALAGRLQAGPSGNLELTVPSSLIKGVFDALDEPGAEFVVRNNRTESAIKVMTKEEVDKLGGTSHITERGHSYHYTLGPIVELPATGEYEKLWAISIKSDDLENIRKSYGLETSPQLGFYIPVGCKKKRVTEDNEVSKLAEAPELATKFIESAELMGSRGRALAYGYPEPEGRDHDYVAFTDNVKKQERLRSVLTELAQNHGYKLKQRDGGFLTASGNNADLSFYPKSKRNDIHKAWALQEDGMSKDDAWAKVDGVSKLSVV